MKQDTIAYLLRLQLGLNRHNQTGFYSKRLVTVSHNHLTQVHEYMSCLSGRGFLGLPQKGVSIITGHFFKRRRSPVPFHLRTEDDEGEVVLAYHLSRQRRSLFIGLWKH